MCHKHMEMSEKVLALPYDPVPVQYFYNRCIAMRGPDVIEHIERYLHDPQVRMFSGYRDNMVCRNKVDVLDNDLLGI